MDSLGDCKRRSVFEASGIDLVWADTLTADGEQLTAWLNLNDLIRRGGPTKDPSGKAVAGTMRDTGCGSQHYNDNNNNNNTAKNCCVALKNHVARAWLQLGRWDIKLAVCYIRKIDSHTGRG